MKRIIVISHYNEDLRWCKLIPKGIDYHIYSRNLESCCNITKIENLGMEAFVYIKYIIDNYHNLPSKILFIQAHEFSWHQNGSIIDIIKNLNWNQEYHSINNNQIKVNLTDNHLIIGNYFSYAIYANEILNLWESIFGKYLPKPKGEYQTMGSSQFLVGKEKILKYPKKFYENIQNEWMSRKDLSIWLTAAVLEYTWDYMFNLEKFI